MSTVTFDSSSLAHSSDINKSRMELSY
jgi:hypothetical protein